MARYVTKDKWPSIEAAERHKTVELNQALRLGDEKFIRNLHISMSRGTIGHVWQQYTINPLPKTVSMVNANLCFGEPFEVNYSGRRSQERFAQNRRDNLLDTLFWSAANLSSGDGGVFADVTLRPDTPMGRRAPVYDIFDELHGIAYSKGREMFAYDKVQDFWLDAPTKRQARLLRLIERNEAGIQTYRLFRGTSLELGSEVPEKEWGQFKDALGRGLFEGLVPEHETGVDDIPGVYFPNVRLDGGFHGTSDYEGLLDFFLALNRAGTLTGETLEALLPIIVYNRQLLGGHKERGDNQLPTGVRQVGVSKMGDKPVELIQGKWDDQSFTRYQLFLVDQALMHLGLDPQIMGRHLDGNVGQITGAGMRLSMTRSLLHASGKKTFFEDGMGRLFRIGAMLDSRTVDLGGYRKPRGIWDDPEEMPEVKLQDGLPADDKEDSQTAQTRANAAVNLHGAGLASIERAVEIASGGPLTLNEGQLAEEYQRLADDQAAAEQVRQDIASTSPNASLFGENPFA